MKTRKDIKAEKDAQSQEEETRATAINEEIENPPSEDQVLDEELSNLGITPGADDPQAAAPAKAKKPTTMSAARKPVLKKKKKAATK